MVFLARESKLLPPARAQLTKPGLKRIDSGSIQVGHTAQVPWAARFLGGVLPLGISGIFRLNLGLGSKSNRTKGTPDPDFNYLPAVHSNANHGRWLPIYSCQCAAASFLFMHGYQPLPPHSIYTLQH